MAARKETSGWCWPVLAPPAFEDDGWVPDVDVREQDGRLVAKVDLPGLKKDDISVEVGEGHLAISGERRTEAAGEKAPFHRPARISGRFYVEIPLAEGATRADVRATFLDGVLEVSIQLPARTEIAVRRVEVDEGGKALKAA
jgi:HSP20 family protein